MYLLQKLKQKVVLTANGDKRNKQVILCVHMHMEQVRT